MECHDPSYMTGSSLVASGRCRHLKPNLIHDARVESVVDVALNVVRSESVLAGSLARSVEEREDEKKEASVLYCAKNARRWWPKISSPESRRNTATFTGHGTPVEHE